MKNVTKILTAVTLCAALFASDQRINALGGNAAFWPGDEANIANFPARMNDHAYVQLTGVGNAAANSEGATILFNHEGTTWGFDWNAAGTDWFNINWGNGDMGVSVGMINQSNGLSGDNEAGFTGNKLGWGKAFSWGEIGVSMDSWTENKTGAGVKDVDTSSMGIHFAKDCGWWVFDSMVANYTSGSVGDMDTSDIGVDMVSHMNAGAADVVFAMGLDMTDDGYKVSTNGTGADDTACATLAADADASNDCHGARNTMTSTLAVEANMTDWATLRAGVNYAYNLSSDYDVTGNDFSWAWGLGFNWGDFTADFTINDNVFSDPIGVITGYGNAITNGSSNTSATFTYSF